MITQTQKTNMENTQNFSQQALQDIIKATQSMKNFSNSMHELGTQLKSVTKAVKELGKINFKYQQPKRDLDILRQRIN